MNEPEWLFVITDEPYHDNGTLIGAYATPTAAAKRAVADKPSGNVGGATRHIHVLRRGDDDGWADSDVSVLQIRYWEFYPEGVALGRDCLSGYLVVKRDLDAIAAGLETAMEHRRMLDAGDGPTE